MLISAAIGILFQFVFRTESNTWDTGRWVETVVIGISRLANSNLFRYHSILLRTLLTHHNRVIPIVD